MHPFSTTAPIIGEMEQVITISAAARITKAAQVMTEWNVGCLVVVNEFHEVVGIITERDVLGWVSSATPESHFAEVGDLMSKNVITCPPDTPPEEVYRIMVRHRIRHLPVVRNGKPVAMISARDVLDDLDEE
ncbi:MAG TPA: CBS domain-containing protein [Phycisphaerae bacterium]|nr:CBS domain-containing protein [Phycisphaerae bacterium]